MIVRYKISIECDVDYEPDKIPRLSHLIAYLQDYMGLSSQEVSEILKEPELDNIDISDIGIEQELLESIEDELEEILYTLQDKSGY